MGPIVAPPDGAGQLAPLAQSAPLRPGPAPGRFPTTFPRTYGPPRRPGAAGYAPAVTSPRPRTPQHGSPPVSVRALVTTRVGALVLAMLVVELLAAMQIYINQTVLPLVASDLGARSHYGLVTAASTVPTFLTMPLGGAMLSRWRADQLMTALTAVLVAGAVAGALAGNVVVYVLAEVARGLAAGALATVTTGIMVAGLPEAWRRAFLAACSAVWVVASLAGPFYAASVSSGWGWRWALVAYVPVLVVARLTMARHIRGLRVADDGEGGAPLVAALAMAAGVAAVGLAPAGSPAFWPVASLGLAGVVWACSRVFPAGVLRLVPGRRAALATLTWVCACYFALDYLLSPAAHDVLGLGPGAVGWVLTAAGTAWSGVALWCGAHPAREPAAYRLRASWAGVLLLVGTGLVSVTLAGVTAPWCLHVGAGLAGAGMGAVHQDTLIRCVTDPVEVGLPADGISAATAATAVTVAGSVGGAAVGTLVTTLVAPTAAGVEAGLIVPVVGVLGLLLGATPLLARRAA